MRSIVILAWVTMFSAATSAIAAPFSGSDISGLVVFGDSLSDTGNVAIATGGEMPPPGYYDGRFSNGPVWVEHLASHLGVASPTPSLAGGTNHAFGGAETGAGIGVVGSPGLLTQIDGYVNTTTPTADELFVVWSGPNDFLLAGEDDAATAVNNIQAGLTALAQSGAKRFLVPNLPDLTTLPGTQGAPVPPFVITPDGIGERTASFNTLLDAALDEFETLFADVELVRFDAAALLESFLSNPGDYGFTNVTDPFLASDLQGDPSEYLFWDPAHITAAAHQAIGDAAARLFDGPGVPEPATAAMVLLGLGVAATRRTTR